MQSVEEGEITIIAIADLLVKTCVQLKIYPNGVVLKV